MSVEKILCKAILLCPHNCFPGKIEDIRVSQYPCKLVNMTSLDVHVGVHLCPNDSTCKPWTVGPNSGLTSFDDIFVAFLTVFQVMTLEGWTGIFYLVLNFYTNLY